MWLFGIRRWIFVICCLPTRHLSLATWLAYTFFIYLYPGKRNTESSNEQFLFLLYDYFTADLPVGFHVLCAVPSFLTFSIISLDLPATDFSWLRDSGSKGSTVPPGTFIVRRPCLRFWNVNGELASWYVIYLLFLGYKFFGFGDPVLLVCSWLCLSGEHRDERGQLHLCAHILFHLWSQCFREMITGLWWQALQVLDVF